MDPRAARPPEPAGVETLDQLAEALHELRVWAGRPSYAQIAARVIRLREERSEPDRPGRITIYDCFRTGRRRLDVRLVSDVITALGVREQDPARAAWDTVLATLGAVSTTREAHMLHPAVEIPAPSERLVGRRAEHLLLSALPPGSVALVTGIGGVGKTELVRHVAAHLLRRLPLPTPALYVDLRGFDPHRPPLDEAAALAVLLRQLGISPTRIDSATRATRREMLRQGLRAAPAVVVMENVPDGEAFAALLPQDGSSRVLATSRRALTLAGDAPPPVTTVSLGPLSETESLDLLTHRIGAERVRAELEESRRLVELTGGIALDLTLAATTVANRPDWTLADHVHRLAATPRDENLRPALLLAYRDLPDAAREAFRLLGLFPASTVPVRAAMLLLDRSEPHELAQVLDVLEREHLVRVPASDAVELHDAVAAFARSVVAQEEPRSRQQRAVHRLADGYVTQVRAALAEQDNEWLDITRGTVLAVAGLASTWGTEEQTLELAALLADRYGQQGHLAEGEALLRHAVACGGPGEAAARRQLGRVLEMQGRFLEAHEQLVLAHRPSDVDAERSLNAIGNVLKRLGRLDEAMATYREAEALAAARGNAVTQGRAIGNLADTLRFRGERAAAAPLYERALAVATAAGDEVNRSIVVANMSISAQESGDYPASIALARESIVLATAAGYEAGIPRSRSHLARVLQEAGLTAEAGEVREVAAREAEASGQRDVYCELLLQQGVATMADDPELAVSSFERAIALSRELANPVHECIALIRLSDLDTAAGELEQARARLAEAARIAAEMGLATETSDIAERLTRLAP